MAIREDQRFAFLGMRGKMTRDHFGGGEIMSLETASSEKQTAVETLRDMPENATFEEMSETLAILAALRQGEADIAAGRVVSHEEVVRRSMAWTSK